MAEEHAAHHPTIRQYVNIAILLAILTAIEVALFYIEQSVDAFTTSMAAPLLILLAILKFVIVVGYYMHLKYEKSLVKKFFAVGFVAAVVLYTVTLIALGVVSGIV
ncbi:MAG: cytochrome C oxidase subunit IV family protein [Acidimicrobiia bacterium]|nr:cytochrome C oxidase subunit IV family protein [Acidimicrobiia bacterium]